MFKKHMHKAMTLAEVTVVIGVIGVLAAIMIPLIKHTLPTKEEEMHKKMTYLVEQISSGMFENESYYPQTKDVSKFGFLNTDEVRVNGESFSGNTKFCRLFAKQFKSVDNQAIVCPDNLDGDPTFRSEDGVDWWIPKTTFTEDGNGQKPGYVKIKIDVNSRDKGGNCGIGDANCKRPDTFYYYIKANGAVTLADPISLSGDTYRILPRLKVKNIDGTSTNYEGYSIPDIGQLCIVRLNDDGEFVTENISCESDSFIGLTPNAKYRVFAVSSNKYSIDKGKPFNENIFGGNVSDIRYRDIKTDRRTKYAEFIFNQPEMHSINVNIISGLIIDNAENYSISDIFEFAGLNTDCAYKDVGENQGDFAKESLLAHGADNYFKYVGPFKGKYKYQCTNESNEEEQPLNFGLDSENKLTIGGLSIGNYQIVITPKEGYCVDPEDDGSFIKRIRLGNKDETVKMRLKECSNTNMSESCAPGGLYRLFEFDGQYTYAKAQNLCSKVGGSLPNADLLHNIKIFKATSENSMDMYFPGGVISVSIETDPETGDSYLVYNNSLHDDDFMAGIDFWTNNSGKYIGFGEYMDTKWMSHLIQSTKNIYGLDPALGGDPCYTSFNNIYNCGLRSDGDKHNVLCVVPDSECPVEEPELDPTTEGCVPGVGYIYKNNTQLTYANAQTACAEHGESFELPVGRIFNLLYSIKNKYEFIPSSGKYYGKDDTYYFDFSNNSYGTSSAQYPSLCIGSTDECKRDDTGCSELGGTYIYDYGCAVVPGDKNFDCKSLGEDFVTSLPLPKYRYIWEQRGDYPTLPSSGCYASSTGKKGSTRGGYCFDFSNGSKYEYDMANTRDKFCFRQDVMKCLGTYISELNMCVVETKDNYGKVNVFMLTNGNITKFSYYGCYQEAGSDFRTPSKTELLNIYNYKNSYPSLPRSGTYWAKNCNTTQNKCYVGINFSNGNVTSYYDTSSKILCIAGGYDR